MMKKDLLFIVFVSSVLLISCGKPLIQDLTEFMYFIDDPANGLIKENIHGEVLFKAQYRPAEYMAARELGSELSAESLSERSRELENSMLISFKIMHQNANADILKGNLSPQAYLDRITYLTGAIQNDFYLLSGSDTIKCDFSHFERAYNITPYNEILLGFETLANDGEDKTLLYHDRIFDYGWIRFDFKHEDFKDIPSLSL